MKSFALNLAVALLFAGAYASDVVVRFIQIETFLASLLTMGLSRDDKTTQILRLLSSQAITKATPVIVQ